MTQRFYYESDGDPGNTEHYVVDRYADPLGDHGRTEPPTDTYMTNAERRTWAKRKAREFNLNPPWPAWDHIQARRDEYEGEIRCFCCDGEDSTWCPVCENTKVTTSPI